MPAKIMMTDLERVEPGRPEAQRIAVMREFGKLELEHARIPQAGDDEIRVKIKWVGICGSDIETFRGTRKPEFMSMPTRLGHEVAGVIDQTKNVLITGQGLSGLVLIDYEKL
ncbi:MAG: alcohol dehydrogenase catalytic domain-containing protein [Opitutales bacterium]|nr:alcohol dehydrogenase catalytic domain-containing protein [Opitutales bacterium]